jgi:hypothetical protein
MDETPTNDTQHWHNLKPPLSPNEQEVEIYKQKCIGYGPVCMFGMTKQLAHLCEYMVDANPVPQFRPVVKSDWFEFDGFASAIMGDGIINLAGPKLIKRLITRCDRLVCRIFTEKLDGMKYAQYFPTSFSGANEVIQTQPHVVMVVWDN